MPEKLLTNLCKPFPEANVLALDIETTGLSPFDDHVVCIAISDGTSGLVFDVRGYQEDSPTPAEWVGWWLAENVFDRRLIIHNASFDLGFLKQHYGVDYPKYVWDTMLAEQLIVAGLDMSASLKDVAYRRVGLELDKTLQTSFSMEGALSPEQVEYALYDVIPLPLIARQQRKELAAMHLGRVWDIERNALPVFTEMVRVGVWIDREILDPLLAEVGEQRDTLQTYLQTELTPYVHNLRIAKHDEMQDELDEWLDRYNAEVQRLEGLWVSLGGNFASEWDQPNDWSVNKWDDQTIDKKDGKPKGQKRYVKARMKEWREERDEEGRQPNKRPLRPKLDQSLINLNSQPQMLAAFTELGIVLPDLQAKTVQATLVDLEPDVRDNIVVPYLKYKKAEKLITAFGDRLIEKMGSDGRLRGNFRQIGTATGRPTCSDPNLLQIPSDQRFRSAFRAGEGKLMVVADYSQMELRILAQMSGDARMRRAFTEGLDLHTYTASLMFGVDFDKVTDKQRKTSKTINFGICYGMGPNKLRATLAAEGIYYSLAEAKAALDNWKATYPDAALWLEQQQNNALVYGYTATPLGRRRNFNVAQATTQSEKGSIRRRGANHVIQGANADLTKLAMVMIEDYLNGRGTIVLQVYDEIVTEVDADVAEEAMEIVRTSMQAAAQTVLTDIPVAVDAVISYSWSEADVAQEVMVA